MGNNNNDGDEDEGTRSRMQERLPAAHLMAETVFGKHANDRMAKDLVLQ